MPRAAPGVGQPSRLSKSGNRPGCRWATAGETPARRLQAGHLRHSTFPLSLPAPAAIVPS